MAYLEARRRICFAPWSHSVSRQTQHLPNEAGGFHPARRCAATTSKISQCYAKWEHCHAPSASHRELARLTRPSHSLEAPAKYSRTATRAQVDVNSTGARGCRPDEESGELLPPAHLERVQGSVQWGQYCICQVRVQRGCVPLCYLKNHIHPRQVVWQRAVLPRRLGSAHAAKLACAL